MFPLVTTLKLLNFSFQIILRLIYLLRNLILSSNYQFIQKLVVRDSLWKLQREIYHLKHLLQKMDFQNPAQQEVVINILMESR